MSYPLLKGFRAKSKDFFWLVVNVSKLIWKANPRYTLVLLVTNTILGILPAVQIWIGKLIVDAIVVSIQSPVPNEVLKRILGLIILGFATALFEDGIDSLRNYAWDSLQDFVDRFLHLQILEKSLSLDLSYYEDDGFFNLLDKVERQATRRPARMMNDLIRLMRSLVSIISVFLLLFHLGWWVVLLLILVNLPQVIFGVHFAGYRYSITDWRSPQSRRLNYFSDLAIYIGRSEIRLYGLKNYFFDCIKRIYQEFIAQNLIFSRRKYTAGFGLVDLFSELTYYVLYLWVILQAIAQRFTLGDVTLYSGAFNRAQRNLAEVFNSFSQVFEHYLFIQDYFTFLKLEPKIASPKKGIRLEKIHPPGIEFRGVTFRYKPEDPDVLKDINLKILPQENIALVGENGAGKTTLLKLLARIYDPQEGEILINGKDLRQYDLDSLYQKIGILLQDYVHYDLTVAENIAFGNLKELNNLTKIKAMAEKAGAAEFIEKLPHGYQTILGRRFEGGVDLSVGQWQRIALARAFMREADLLILDEPTASLDAKAEYEIFNKFIELVQGKIAILISHRFSTVRLAQKIYVLQAGEIIEQGSHAELIRQEGLYAEMFKLQAAGYQ